jgi:hypothetical protein
MEGVDWMDLAQDRDGWRALVNAVMKHSSFIKCGEFLDYLRTFYFLRKDSAPRSWLVSPLVTGGILKFCSLDFQQVIFGCVVVLNNLGDATCGKEGTVITMKLPPDK